MLEAALIGLLVEIFTKLSERWNVSQTYIALGLSVILGAGYYIAVTYYSVEWQQVVQFAAGVYASSQLIYSLCKKRGIFNQKEQSKSQKKKGK